MRIDHSNINDILEELYIHDACFGGYTYDYAANRITFEAVDNYRQKRLIFKFVNVLAMKMLCVDFWGASNRLHLCESGKDYQYPLLSELKEKNKTDDIPKERIDTIDYAVEIIFTLISGDSIDIVCEYIEFEISQLAVEK